MPKPPLPRDVLDLLSKPNPAVIVTLQPDGQPVSVATWYVLDGDRILVNMSKNRRRLAYLRKEPPYADTPRPDLILLDLNLPRRDGREVLQEIKDDPGLRHIPVVVLTTSQAEEDVLRSYQLHANAYVTKPVDFEGFIEAIKQIDHFFVSVVQLP